MKLYELTETYKNIENLLNDEDADIETLEKALEDVQDNIENKAENIAKIVRNIDGDIKVLKEEEKRLSERRKALENKQKNVKKYLEYQLKSLEIDKVKAGLFTVSIQSNAPSVRVVDEGLIPSDFIYIKTSISKREILQALKDGKEVPGAEIKQTKSIRIR